MAGIDENWELQPPDGRPEGNSAHVWRGRFQPITQSEEELAKTLSEQEMQRAQRFVRQMDRDRYIFSHLLLRKILAAYLGCEPRGLEFNTARYGKPFVEFLSSRAEISFSLSHSMDMTLIAVAGGTEVGIDVEFIREIKDVREIVDRFFSTNERSFLNSIAPPDFNEAFFSYWTSKEAFIKGVGKGLSYPLDKFSVRFPDAGPLGWISIDDEHIATPRWNVIRILPWPNYSGALAMETPLIKPRFFEYRAYT